MTCCSSLRKTVLRAKRLACRRVLTLSLVATVTSGLRVALCSRTPRFCELVLLFGLRSLVVFSPFWASSPKSAFGNTLSWGSCLLFRGRDPQALSSQFLLMSRLLHVGMRPARVPRVSVAWALVAPGYLADFVLLDRDITACDPSEIQGARVVATYVAGERIPAAEKRVNNQGK